MSACGVCVVCLAKRPEVWAATPCSHEVCSGCLEGLTDVQSCSGCGRSVECLACPGRQHGCGFDTSRGDWKEHAAKCLFLPAHCPNRCDEVVVRRDLLSHLTTDCQLRLAACKFCNTSCFQVEVADHENSCPEARIACEYCLQKDIKRGELSGHAQSCSKTPKPCPLKGYGCDFSGLDIAIGTHLNLKNHAAFFERFRKREEERDAEIERMKTELESCRLELRSCKSELDSWKSELDSCKNELIELADGGIHAFDSELLWLTQVPDREKGVLVSPLYRHRCTKDLICFTLRASSPSPSLMYRDGSALAVHLRQHRLMMGGTSRRVAFGVQVNAVDGRELCKRDGLGRDEEELVEWNGVVGCQYIVRYWQEEEIPRCQEVTPRVTT